MNEFIINPHSDATVQEFLYRFEEILKDKKPVKITMKKYTQSSLPQKALLHIWVREYAAHYYKKPKPETIKKWIGVNRNKFSIEIFELERIINSGTADDFTN